MALQETIKMPIAVLKVGETRHCRLDIEFPDAPVTFTLIQVNLHFFIITCIESMHIYMEKAIKTLENGMPT